MSSLNDSSQKQLKQYVEQIERLEEEKAAIGSDIKDKYDEAASNGFDKKIMRQVIRLRKKSREQRQEEETILDVYLHALGMATDDSDETAATD